MNALRASTITLISVASLALWFGSIVDCSDEINLNKLLKMKTPSVVYCNKDVLETLSADHSEQTKAQSEIRRKQLLAFCADNYQRVLLKNLIMIGMPIRKELGFFNEQIHHQVGESREEEVIKAAIQVFQDDTTNADSHYKEGLVPKCKTVVEHFESLEYIKLKSGKEEEILEEIEANDQLSKMFQLYDYCKVHIKYFSNQPETI